jgi:hypothetical protein
MGSWIRRQGPTFAVACMALVVALGGTVYAAAKIDGRSIRPGSLPGNRLERGSVAGNRLQPGSIGGGRIAPGSLTGVQVDASTLGKVAEAAQADQAGSARVAASALGANFAADAGKLNGRTAGCHENQLFFAGACWDTATQPAIYALGAAETCAARGGELPSALSLLAFARQPGVQLAVAGEWTRDIGQVTLPNEFTFVTVSRNLTVDVAAPLEFRPFRCVTPLVS